MMDNIIVAPLQSTFETRLEENNLENTTDVSKVQLCTAQGKKESQSWNTKVKSLKGESRKTTSDVSSENGMVPEIHCRKIRERVIHLLALKPYKKLELCTRLQNEGLRKAEQLIIGNILRDIAQLRQNEYSLKNYMWREVNENWPYYTEHEQQQLKLHKAQNVMNLSTADEVSSISNPSLRSTTSVSPPSEIVKKKGLKRTSLVNEEPQAAKKRRITRAPVRNENKKKLLNSANILRQQTKNIPASKPTQQQKEKNGNKQTTVNTTKRSKKNQHKEAVLQTIFDDTQQKLLDQKPILPSKSDTTVSATYQKNKFFPSSPEESDSDTCSYRQYQVHFLPKTSREYKARTETASYDFSWYTPITSIEQRRQYKADFDEDYEEYFPLLQRVEEVRHIFRELPMQLQRAPEGSAEYERIKESIFKEYEILNSAEEIQLKQRFDYLEAKLLHIKQLVDDFDEKLLMEKAVEAAVTMAKEYHLVEQQKFGETGQFEDF